MARVIMADILNSSTYKYQIRSSVFNPHGSDFDVSSAKKSYGPDYLINLA